jgi:hypothetical protein
MRRQCVYFWSAATLLAVVGLATAQRRPATQPQGSEPAPPVPPGVQAPADFPEKVPGPPLRDPTSPSAKMREVLGTKKSGGPGMKVAPMSLVGRVIARNKPPLALLSIDDRIYTVGKDSVVTGPNNTIVKILDITPDSVRVEMNPGKEVFLLR